MTELSRDQVVLKRWVLVILINILVFLLLTTGIFYLTRDNTLGTDFYIYYTAGRNVTVNHLSPYDESVGRLSQMAILKHEAQPSEDQLRFVYPPYGLIPVLPLSGLPFPWAQAAWTAFILLTLHSILLFCFHDIPRWIPATIFLCFPFFFGVLLGNLNMPVISILFITAARLPRLKKENRLESVLLGLLLAWATVKPQFSGFFILFYMLFAIKRRSWAFVISFLLGVAGFLLVSFIIAPDWIAQWLEMIRRYPNYTGGRMPITPLLNLLYPDGGIVSYIIMILLAAGVMLWCFYRWWKGDFSALRLLALGAFIVYIFHPTGVSYEQMIFLFPFILFLFQDWKRRSGRSVVLWLLLLVSSWFFFYLSLSHIWLDAAYYGLFLLYIIWLAVFLLTPESSLKLDSPEIPD
jgi:hypothetical protein